MQVENKVKVIDRGLQEGLAAAQKVLSTEGEGVNLLAYCFHNETVVLKDMDGVNLLYTTIHNIPVYHCFSRGGTIVAQEGDFSFIYVHDKRVKNDDLVGRWEDWLTRRGGINLVAKDNDLCVKENDKYFKVSGSNYYKTKDGRVIETLHLSIAPRILQHIKNICIKPMVKEPKGLMEFDKLLTTDWVREEWLEFLKNEKILDNKED